jgi:hypothetical protein
MVAAVTACQSSASHPPDCDRVSETTFILAAQAVPTSPIIPCLEPLVAGWHFSGSQISNGSVRFWLDSNVAGAHSVEVELVETCDATAAAEVQPEGLERGVARVYVLTERLSPLTRSRFIVFDGGCIVHRYRFQVDAPLSLADQAEESLSFLPRERLVEYVRDRVDGTLCGVGAPPCEG